MDLGGLKNVSRKTRRKRIELPEKEKGCTEKSKRARKRRKKLNTNSSAKRRPYDRVA